MQELGVDINTEKERLFHVRAAAMQVEGSRV